jgi:hypothetical protein
MNMENQDGMISTRKISWFVHQRSLSIPPAVIQQRSRGIIAKAMLNAYQVSLSYLQGSLTCRQSTILDRRLSFTLDEVLLRVFIGLKNSSSVRFELVNLGSNGKHTTTRPPSATAFKPYTCVTFLFLREEWNKPASETTVSALKSTRRHAPEDERPRHLQSGENRKSHTLRVAICC